MCNVHFTVINAVLSYVVFTQAGANGSSRQSYALEQVCCCFTTFPLCLVHVLPLTQNPSSIIMSSRSESDLRSCETTLKQLQRKPCFQRGFTAQSVEHRTGIAEVMGLNPVGASECFPGFICNCLSYFIAVRISFTSIL